MNYVRKINSPLIICHDFESILMPENKGKQNSRKSYTDNYQKHIAFNQSYKLVCVDDKFNKLFKPYLGEDVFYNFINSIIEEGTYCNEVMKKHFKKELQ